MKQSTIKAAQYNGVMVFFILMRVSVKGKRTGIKMLEQFHTHTVENVSVFFYNVKTFYCNTQRARLRA